MDAYNWSLGDIVEEDEVAEHGDEAEETESSHNVDHCVLQVKLSWNLKFNQSKFIKVGSILLWHWLRQIKILFFQFSRPTPTCSALDDDDELDAIGLVQGSSPLLVEMGVTEVPTHWVQQTEVVSGHKFNTLLRRVALDWNITKNYRRRKIRPTFPINIPPVFAWVLLKACIVLMWVIHREAKFWSQCDPVNLRAARSVQRSWEGIFLFNTTLTRLVIQPCFCLFNTLPFNFTFGF